MFLQVRIISLELIRIQCFIFSDNPSPFMRHEIARHTKHPSHVVLFNFRGGARVSIKQGWGVKVSGCPDTVGAIDGVEYLAGVLENAETFNVGEVLVPKKVVMMGLCHEDLSAYTKPNSRDYQGKQRYQVSERGDFWIVSNLNESPKKSRMSSGEGENIVIVRMSGGRQGDENQEDREAGEDGNDGGGRGEG